MGYLNLVIIGKEVGLKGYLELIKGYLAVIKLYLELIKGYLAELKDKFYGYSFY